MAFKDMFNKVNSLIKEKQQEHEQYNQRVANSKVFTLNNSIQINNDNIVLGNAYEYANTCPYIDFDFAKIIDGMIPLYETVLMLGYFTQKKDNENYLMILTDIRIIIMDKEKYTNINYNEITKFEIISKSLMSQIVDFNEIIIGIDINSEELELMYNLLTNISYRNNYIVEKKKYLCGITPIYQKLNKINSGISIDQNKIVVFHDKKINNYICRYDDILNYEVMEDNTPVIKRKTNEQKQAMGGTKKECMRMTLRVTLTNNQIFEISILEPSTFNSTYNHSDSKYTTEYNFLKEIVDKLDSMNDKLYVNM